MYASSTYGLAQLLTEDLMLLTLKLLLTKHQDHQKSQFIKINKHTTFLIVQGPLYGLYLGHYMDLLWDFLFLKLLGLLK